MIFADRRDFYLGIRVHVPEDTLNTLFENLVYTSLLRYSIKLLKGPRGVVKALAARGLLVNSESI